MLQTYSFLRQFAAIIQGLLENIGVWVIVPCPTLMTHPFAPPPCPTPLPHPLAPPRCLAPLPHPLAPPPVSIVHHCFLTGSVFTLGLFGCCCPCCFMISLSQRMGEGCCFPICCPGALLAMRVKLRSENGIQVRYSTTSIPILFINEPDVFLTH